MAFKKKTAKNNYGVKGYSKPDKSFFKDLIKPVDEKFKERFISVFGDARKLGIAEVEF